MLNATPVQIDSKGRGMYRSQGTWGTVAEAVAQASTPTTCWNAVEVHDFATGETTVTRLAYLIVDQFDAHGSTFVTYADGDSFSYPAGQPIPTRA